MPLKLDFWSARCRMCHHSAASRQVGENTHEVLCHNMPMLNCLGYNFIDLNRLRLMTENNKSERYKESQLSIAETTYDLNRKVYNLDLQPPTPDPDHRSKYSILDFKPRLSTLVTRPHSLAEIFTMPLLMGWISSLYRLTSSRIWRLRVLVSVCSKSFGPGVGIRRIAWNDMQNNIHKKPMIKRTKLTNIFSNRRP